jgi:hypothetical protein
MVPVRLLHEHEIGEGLFPVGMPVSRAGAVEAGVNQDREIFKVEHAKERLLQMGKRGLPPPIVCRIEESQTRENPLCCSEAGFCWVERTRGAIFIGILIASRVVISRCVIRTGGFGGREGECPGSPKWECFPNY